MCLSLCVCECVCVCVCVCVCECVPFTKWLIKRNCTGEENQPTNQRNYTQKESNKKGNRREKRNRNNPHSWQKRENKNELFLYKSRKMSWNPTQIPTNGKQSQINPAAEGSRKDLIHLGIVNCRRHRGRTMWFQRWSLDGDTIQSPKLSLWLSRFTSTWQVGPLKTLVTFLQFVSHICLNMSFFFFFFSFFSVFLLIICTC